MELEDFSKDVTQHEAMPFDWNLQKANKKNISWIFFFVSTLGNTLLLLPVDFFEISYKWKEKTQRFKLSTVINQRECLSKGWPSKVILITNDIRKHNYFKINKLEFIEKFISQFVSKLRKIYYWKIFKDECPKNKWNITEKVHS